MRFFNIFLLLLFEFASLANTPKPSNPVYICTASDASYYPCLINLIGSLHQHNYHEITQIAVFDLGLTEDQKKFLATIKHLSVYQIEKTNPDLLTRFNTRAWGKPVPGWYAWKAVILKQAFDLFGFESTILYIDAGTTIMNSLSILFEYINEHGYFFHNGSPWDLNRETTQFVKNAFGLYSSARSWMLEPKIKGLEAGFMGVTKSIYDAFVRPMYELSKDLRYFADDGSCTGGFGNSRHDIPLFSIHALLNGYTIHHHFEQPRMPIYLDINTQRYPFYIACNAQDRIQQTHVYCARFDVNPAQLAPFIHHHHIHDLFAA